MNVESEVVGHGDVLLWEELQTKIRDINGVRQKEPQKFYERITAVATKWSKWNHLLALSRWDLEKDLQQGIEDAENLWYDLNDEFTIIF